MKFSAIILACLTGLSLAAPAQQHHQEGYTQPGGDHKYHDLAQRSPEANNQLLAKRLGPVAVAAIKVVGIGILGSIIGKTVGERYLNAAYGKQTAKRGLEELPFDAQREAFTEYYAQALLDEANKNVTANVVADAVACSGAGFYVSDPKATLGVMNYEFSVGGQKKEYDCLIVKGPVTVEVRNSTSADFQYAAAANTTSTYKNGVLTIV